MKRIIAVWVCIQLVFIPWVTRNVQPMTPETQKMRKMIFVVEAPREKFPAYPDIRHPGVTFTPVVMPDYEWDYVARVVEAEAGNQGLLGKMAVAQVILNRMPNIGTAFEVVTAVGQFAPPHATATEETFEAMSLVFHEGHVAIAANIEFFHADYSGYSGAWTENIEYVATIGNHVFYQRR